MKLQRDFCKREATVQRLKQWPKKEKRAAHRKFSRISEGLRQQLDLSEGLGRMEQMRAQINVLYNAFKTAENEVLGYDAENAKYTQTATALGTSVHEIPTKNPFGSKRSRVESLFRFSY
jgi:hypothetical protein